MFGFQFEKKRTEVQSYLRRLSDLTVPNLLEEDADHRAESRSNRTLAVLAVPWEDGAGVDNEVVIATTKDVSSGGISLVLPSPFHVEELLVGFWPFDPQAAEAEDAPAYFLGHVQQRAEIGGGYWQLGIRVARRLDDPGLAERLLPYARRLLPHAFRSRAVAAVSTV